MIFVDSSAWIALEIPDDTNHGAAVAVWKRVQRGEFGTAVTSDGVLSESLTAARMDGGLEAAESLGRRVLEGRAVRVVWTTPEVFREGWALMRRRRDKRWSLTDCISFIHMEGSHVETAFSFDEDFRQAGFPVVPETK